MGKHDQEEITSFFPEELLVVVKRGDQGAQAFCDAKAFHVPAIAVDVVDTTGAGDCFNAGFLYGWVKGFSIERCLQYGNICGGLSVRDYGQAAIPHLEELLLYQETWNT
jgi:sugar/nucleoside kinase (ribokinase family)